MTRIGHLALLLHAHLPFVRHPETPRPLEEHWLFEALTDSYLPLLELLFEASRRGSGFRLTLSLSPTLLSMFADRLLAQRYRDYLRRLAGLCDAVAAHRGSAPQRRALGRFYAQRLARIRAFYLERIGGDLIGALARLQTTGMLEFMTTAATHGYLPLLRSRPVAVRAQLRVGRDCFRDIFGRAPDGLWLPECGYYPGLENEIAAAGFRYFVLDAHALQQAPGGMCHSIYAPHSVGATVAVFIRDPDSARELWCPNTGYPGHPWYREYHSDLGYEGQRELLADFLPPGVQAAPTGLRFHRVTGGDAAKAPYDPSAAMAQAKNDARRFLERRRRLLASLPLSSRPPLVVAPYDAELFGHWWFEGPVFLRALVRYLDQASDLATVTLGQHLRGHETATPVRPMASSWGEHGYNGAWLKPETGWVYQHLHQAAGELQRLIKNCDRSPSPELHRRVLRQAARSLLLAQSSDWTFHMGRNGGSTYCLSRLRDQLARFRYLTDSIQGAAVDGERLVALEGMDNPFPNLDLRHFL